jgi:hypothetical protein
MSQFDWPITKKKLKLWRLPQDRRSYGKMDRLALWPTHIGEKGRTLGKTYGIQGEVLLGTLGTYWEPEGGTYWEQRKNEKKSSPNPTQNLREKNSWHFECMMSLPIGSS